MNQSVRLVQATKPDISYILDIYRDMVSEEYFKVVEKHINEEVGPEDILVHIARVSSSREDTFEDPEPLIRYLIKNNHWSPFEHTFCTFEIITSLPIATQYLRHRSFTFQQFSQRYGKAPGVMSIELRNQADTNRQSSTDHVATVHFKTPEETGTSKWDYTIDSSVVPGTDEYLGVELIADSIVDSLYAYDFALEAGIAKETARFVLPQATQTKLYMTGSLRSWIHLIGLREDGHAQKEAQKIATMIKKDLIDQFPLTSRALQWI